MSDDIRRIQDDLQRQRQEIERSASLLKNTQPRVFSGSDGSYKSPNKRFAFASTDFNQEPFSITSRSSGIGVTAGTINGIIPTNLFTFGTRNKDCTIIARCTCTNGVVKSAVLEVGPSLGKPQEWLRGQAPEALYVPLVKITAGIPSRLVSSSVSAWPIWVRNNLTYPPELFYSWNFFSGGVASDYY
jgi:hypothetical protein